MAQNFINDIKVTPFADSRTDAEKAQHAFAVDLEAQLDRVRAILIAKNRKYGDAALNPKQTFAKCDAIELINVRMDDKLSRIANRQDDEDEDPHLDLLGYLIIREIAIARKKGQ
jgi:hypothetical protein